MSDLVFLVIHPPLPLVMAIELGLTVFFGLRELGELESLSEVSAWPEILVPYFR